MADYDDLRAIPGIEARHQWTGPNGVPIYIHDPYGGLPRMKCSDINGFRALPDLDDVRDSAVGMHGEVPRLAFRRGKTITYEGAAPGAGIQADKLDTLRLHEGKLLEALGDPSVEGRVDFQRTDGTGFGYFFKARCVSFDPDEKQTLPPTAMPSPWQRTVTLAMRLSLPFIFYNNADVYTSANAPGNANVNWNVTNRGAAPAYPVVRFRGPLTGPRLTTNRPGGFFLAFKPTFVIPAGQDYDFDFATRRLTKVSDGSRVSAAIDWGTSTWFDEGVPGIRQNATEQFTLYQAAGFPGINSKATVTNYPPFWA